MKKKIKKYAKDLLSTCDGPDCVDPNCICPCHDPELWAGLDKDAE